MEWDWRDVLVLVVFVGMCAAWILFVPTAP
jgi:hypothetical protein